MPLIEVYGLTKRFGSSVAVEDLNLAVEQGEVLGLLGPNGAGKTTTIRMLAGMISATSGYALVAGHRTDGDVEQLHEAIGLLTERPGHYGRLSARRNLEFFAGFYRNIDAGAQVDRYIRAVGLQDRQDDKAGTFSKGMQQRLALARALLHEPKVLFLDEPTAGLDPEAAEEVRGLVKSLSGEGRTILISTHNLAEAEVLCHRVAVIRTKLIAIDTPDGLRRRLFRRRVFVRLETVNTGLVEALSSLPYVESIEQDGARLFVELGDPEAEKPEVVREIVARGGNVMEVGEEQHSLEEVYLNLIKEEAGRDV